MYITLTNWYLYWSALSKTEVSISEESVEENKPWFCFYTNHSLLFIYPNNHLIYIAVVFCISGLDLVLLRVMLAVVLVVLGTGSGIGRALFRVQQLQQLHEQRQKTNSTWFMALISSLKLLPNFSSSSLADIGCSKSSWLKFDLS